jgi:hypothetical protein
MVTRVNSANVLKNLGSGKRVSDELEEKNSDKQDKI